MTVFVITELNEKRVVAFAAAISLVISHASLIPAKEPRTIPGAPVIVQRNASIQLPLDQIDSARIETAKYDAKPKPEAPVIRALPGLRSNDKVDPSIEKKIVKRPEAPVIRVSQSEPSSEFTVKQPIATEVPVVRRARTMPITEPIERTSEHKTNELSTLNSIPNTPLKPQAMSEVPVIRVAPTKPVAEFVERTSQPKMNEPSMVNSIPNTPLKPQAVSEVPVIRVAPTKPVAEFVERTSQPKMNEPSIVKSIPNSPLKSPAISEVPVIRVAPTKPVAPNVELTSEYNMKSTPVAKLITNTVVGAPTAAVPDSITAPAPIPRPKQIIKLSKPSFDWHLASSRFQSEGQLNLAVRQASSLRAESLVARCEVENNSVCEALHFEPTEISVVGKAPGQTRIAIWLEEQPDPMVWTVRVAEQKKTTSVASDNQALKELLTDMYPQSQVRLVSSEGELIVEGKAKNRKEAIQILSFIRSVRLIPVVDRISLKGR